MCAARCGCTVARFGQGEVVADVEQNARRIVVVGRVAVTIRIGVRAVLRIVQIGKSKPVIPTIISKRLIASRGVLAWMVVRLPS